MIRKPWYILLTKHYSILKRNELLIQQHRRFSKTLFWAKIHISYELGWVQLRSNSTWLGWWNIGLGSREGKLESLTVATLTDSWPWETACVLRFLSDPMDYSPPDFSVHGISQARILEWVAISSSGDLPNPEIEPFFSSVSWLQVDSLLLSHQGSPEKLLDSKFLLS